MRYRLGLLAGAVGVAACFAVARAQSSPTPPTAAQPAPAPQQNVNDWLLNAPDDVGRFKLLQTFLRGFELPMWEIGERYQAIYDALGDKNYELAAYHWEKIKVAMVTGYLKRPKRQPNADEKFIKKIWDDVNKALLSTDPKLAWDAFASTRQACMSCHEAEKVAFINKQTLFRRTEMPPK